MAEEQVEVADLGEAGEMLYECSICKVTHPDVNFILYRHECGQTPTSETTEPGREVDGQVVAVYSDSPSPSGYVTEDGDFEDCNISRENFSGNIWLHKEVSLLLELYKQHKNLFNNPRVKKVKVWRKIGHILKKSPEMCDKKFRNLKTRYKAVKNLTLEGNKGRRKWEFFDVMDDLMTDEPAAELQGQCNASETTEAAAYSESSSPSAYAFEYDDSDDYRLDRESGNVWLHSEVPLLLKLYKQNKHLFNDPSIKKLDLWRKIAQVLKKPPEKCDKKFRDLKMRYKMLKTHYSNNGGAKKRWEYFEIMQEILSDDSGDESHPSVTTFPQSYMSPSATPSTSRQVAMFSSEEKLRKRNLQDSPQWFRDIWLDQTSRLEKISKQQVDIQQIQQEMIKVQKERNLILQDINKVLFSKNNAGS